MFMAKYCTGI